MWSNGCDSILLIEKKRREAACVQFKPLVFALLFIFRLKKIHPYFAEIEVFDDEMKGL